ncbi:bacillithiol system redox-active protein YtxJ [Pullulanibacillus sp. KACC 23026]|uniref:bacillithiol system redox-active protein YtxJ n=1 Tax=Pullulanibacillus sp. KACC 23026 TaxID=3028315 RepID=UPI0023B0EFC9|nr:bacillithiol system redox-active protein YtxJ [Pullulanibacillus sp. KACC 23026]WEG14359.1 bacillithiol system redox-active protein YtxJ [Pullulanibacillus sp. KACC 23026]
MANLREITSEDDWKALLDDSSEKPVVLLKHSTTCPISANAWNEFNHTLEELEAKGVETAYVKVIESRPVSLKIADELGVTHQSPQAILIKNKQATWNTSHWDITHDALLKEVQ